MAGLSAIHSKLRTLNNITVAKVKGKQVSVVHYTDRDNVVFPENCNKSGILLIPESFEQNGQGLAAWQAKHGNNL